VLHVAIILIVIGLLLYLVVKYIPMEATIQRILIGVVVIGTVLWLLNVFGIFDLGTVPVHRFN